MPSHCQLPFKLKWRLTEIIVPFIQENAFENAVYTMLPGILFRHWFVISKSLGLRTNNFCEIESRSNSLAASRYLSPIKLLLPLKYSIPCNFANIHTRVMRRPEKSSGGDGDHYPHVTFESHFSSCNLYIVQFRIYSTNKQMIHVYSVCWSSKQLEIV